MNRHNNHTKATSQALAHPNFSGMASYCQVSGIALAVTCQFGGTALAGNLVAHYHPAMLAPTNKLLEVAAQYYQQSSGSETEQYLLVAATLHSLGLLQQSCPLAPAIKTLPKLWAAYCNALSSGTFSYIYQRAAEGKPCKLPQYSVTKENAADGLALTEYLKLLVTEVATVQEFWAAISVGRTGPTKKHTPLSLLEDELALEQELKQIMAGPASVRYNAKTRKRALAQLASEESCPAAAIFNVRRCLDADATPSEQQLRDALATCKDFLNLHDSAHREVSLAVIKQLEVQLSTMLEVEQELGFIILEEEAGAASATVRYTTKTKVTDMVDVLVLPTQQAGRRLSLAEQLQLRKAAKLAASQELELARSQS